MNVTCVIPTRGNVDLTPILDTLAWCDEVVVWDNSVRDDLGIYGRYQAIIDEARNDVIVTQDDDLIVTDWPRLLRAYEPGVLTVNYPQPADIAWVARGAVFDRHLPFDAFDKYYSRGWQFDRDFTHWICDGVFAELTDRVKMVDFGSQDLEYCNDPGRISSEPIEWYHKRRPLIKERCAR